MEFHPAGSFWSSSDAGVVYVVSTAFRACFISKNRRNGVHAKEVLLILFNPVDGQDRKVDGPIGADVP